MRIRPAQTSDLDAVASMCHALWPDASAEEHAREKALILAGKPPGTLPLTIFVAEDNDGDLAGFVEVDLRSHADGCDIAIPVGYVEGWYVAEEYRRKGVGAQLVLAAEDWARQQGCIEMASDAWLDGTVSQRAHEALGYEVVDRCVHYRKRL